MKAAQSDVKKCDVTNGDGTLFFFGFLLDFRISHIFSLGFQLPLAFFGFFFPSKKECLSSVLAADVDVGEGTNGSEDSVALNIWIKKLEQLLPGSLTHPLKIYHPKRKICSQDGWSENPHTIHVHDLKCSDHPHLDARGGKGHFCTVNRNLKNGCLNPSSKG